MGRVGPAAYASPRRATGQIRTFPDKWRTNCDMNAAAGLTPQEFADELFATKNLCAPTYQRLHRELDENRILEFCMLVGITSWPR